MTKPSATKKPRQKRPITQLSGPGKLLMTALSFGAFVGGWSVIIQQEDATQENVTSASTESVTQTAFIPQPQPVAYQAPALKPLLVLAPIPTIAPLLEIDLQPANPTEGTNEQPAVAPIVLPTLAPLPTLEALPAAPPTPAPVTSTASQVSPSNFILHDVAGSYSNGLTNFEWTWYGEIPAGYGFEVLVWRPGGPLLGAHDAVADNLGGRIVALGGGRYGTQLDIRYAAGVQNQTGDYLWAVALVRVSPSYKNSGVHAQPAYLYFDAGGGRTASTGGGGNRTRGS